ncbi:MAG TPA: hypothetical protein VEB03_00535 [Candidatus Nanoarchaeia archaeon]|nr:hypothetical protein [Candidatus Nanoarchaeia archaeon]
MKTGTMLMREGIVLPKSVPLDSTTYANGWRTVTGYDNFSLDRKLRTVGWGLLFIAGEVKSISVGPHSESTVRRTVSSVLGKIRALNLNCASVTSISDRRFLGIPYTVVTGSAYNLQHGQQLKSAADRKRHDLKQDRASNGSSQ